MKPFTPGLCYECGKKLGSWQGNPHFIANRFCIECTFHGADKRFIAKRNLEYSRKHQERKRANERANL